MSKHYLSLLAFATLLCMMLFGAVSCKKDETPDPNDADYFIDVDFLPESETNGEVAPRLLVNFNNELAMIEIRPPADTLIETVLFLCPEHKTIMMCGKEDLMVFAEYDMETNMPSCDVLLVTPMDDNALLLTKGFMDWNTNTLTTGDMMVLPIDGTSKSRGTRGYDEDMRLHFYNHLVKPITEEFESWENFSGALGFKQAQLIFMSLKYIVSATAPRILFSDNPELLREHMVYPFSLATAQGVQTGMIRTLPVNMRDAVSKGVAFLSWSMSGGHGVIVDYEGETGGENGDLWGNYFYQGYKTTTISTSAVPTPMYYVNLNVGNVTENSAYLKGNFRYGSSITPVEMGYIFKISGGPEHTEYDMNFNGITVSGLQKATKYTAFAYVKSALGDRVLSPGVTFWTLGFEAFPNSLTFPTEGDTKYVGLCYSEEDIRSWDITSKPSWCNITIDDLGLLAVTVGASTETRSGTITITAHSNTLGNVTEDIEVTQLGTNSWEGTSWVFTGMVTTHDIDGSSSSNEVGFTLMVNSVPNNIEFSYAQILSSGLNGYSENYVIDGNDKLVYNASATYSGEWGSNHITSRVIFTRTSSTTATADLQYRETYSNYVATMSGLLQGTLIRDDEIGNYETTASLKTPVLIINL